MASTRASGARLDPALIDAARDRAGLTGASVSTVIRYALAVLAGVDPERAIAVRRGPRREVSEA